MNKRDERILELWAEGLTGGPIVRTLALEGYKITKSIIAGVVHRAGKNRYTGYAYSKKGTPFSRLGGQSMERPDIASKKKAPPKPIAYAEDEPKPIGDPDDIPEPGFCKFFKDDIKRGSQACGHPTPGSTKPYCEWHLAYIRKGVYTKRPITDKAATEPEAA